MFQKRRLLFKRVVKRGIGSGGVILIANKANSVGEGIGEFVEVFLIEEDFVLFKGNGGGKLAGRDNLFAFGESNIIISFTVALYIDVINAFASLNGFGINDVFAAVLSIF